MKFIYFLLFVSLFGVGSVNAADMTTGICNNEYLQPFINIVSTIVNLIKIGVPIILIVLGMIDMGKAVASQKDDKIKAGQKILISRLITGGIVFFIVAIVQMLVSIIEGATGKSEIMNCVCKFVGACDSSDNNNNNNNKNNNNNNNKNNNNSKKPNSGKINEKIMD